MEQNTRTDKNNMEIKLDSEGEPLRHSSKKYLGKKIVILVLFFLISGAVGYAYSLFFGGKDDNQFQNAEVMKEEEVKKAEIDRQLDTDQDKLPDYLEKILGTSESNPDTDGDGYDDLAEIKNGYSPLTSEKFTDEEWYNIKKKIKGEDEGLFEKEFGNFAVNSEFTCGIDIVSDIDGNTYNTVQIGFQCWLKENLKVTKNPKGETITRYCYDNDPKICDTDGGLYDWNTAMNNSAEEGAQGICSSGWHVPRDEEWYVLENYLKDSDQICNKVRSGTWDCAAAGIKLKSNGSSGFEGVLAGVHNTDNSFVGRGMGAYFWSSPRSDTDAWFRGLGSDISTILRAAGDKSPSYSLRCLKDYK